MKRIFNGDHNGLIERLVNVNHVATQGHYQMVSESSVSSFIAVVR